MPGNYMSAPESKTIKGFKEALDIVARHHKGGENAKCFTYAEHDIIYFELSLEDVPEDSEEGKRLDALGFHASTEFDCWAYFT